MLLCSSDVDENTNFAVVVNGKESKQQFLQIHIRGNRPSAWYSRHPQRVQTKSTISEQFYWISLYRLWAQANSSLEDLWQISQKCIRMRFFNMEAPTMFGPEHSRTSFNSTGWHKARFFQVKNLDLLSQACLRLAASTSCKSRILWII